MGEMTTVHIGPREWRAWRRRWSAFRGWGLPRWRTLRLLWFGETLLLEETEESNVELGWQR